MNILSYGCHAGHSMSEVFMVAGALSKKWMDRAWFKSLVRCVWKVLSGGLELNPVDFLRN
jgi:hypothetical protein